MSRPISKGDVIALRDISWTKMREDAIRRDVVLDPDQLVGLTPRQSLRANQMISSSELQRPLMVARGALVTMVLRSGSMSLSAQGHAIEQGSVGDIIRVTNKQSNLTVEGKVEGPNLVSVSPNGATALAN